MMFSDSQHFESRKNVQLRMRNRAVHLTSSRCIIAVGVLLTAVQFALAQQSQPATSRPAVAGITGRGAPSTPRLHLSRDTWDFGQVWYGDPCRTEVKLTNIGTDTLRITKVRSSCGCTVAKPKKQVLAPGESDMMSVTYNTRKLTKKVHQTITIESNDPITPQVRLKISGEVWQAFEATPAPRLAFGQLMVGSESKMSIELVSNMEERANMRLPEISPNVPFTFELEELDPGLRYKLTAHTRPPLRKGANNFSLVLDTGLTRQPKMAISVNAYAAERVSVMPYRLPVFPLQKKTGMRLVRLNYLEDQPIKITGLKSNNPLVKVAIVKTPRHSSARTIFKFHEVRVMIPAWEKLPDEGTSIEILTDDPDPRFQKFVVPIEKRRPNEPPKKKPAPRATPGGKSGAAAAKPG